MAFPAESLTGLNEASHGEPFNEGHFKEICTALCRDVERIARWDERVQRVHLASRNTDGAQDREPNRQSEEPSIAIRQEERRASQWQGQVFPQSLTGPTGDVNPGPNWPLFAEVVFRPGRLLTTSAVVRRRLCVLCPRGMDLLSDTAIFVFASLPLSLLTAVPFAPAWRLAIPLTSLNPASSRSRRRSF
ncbi:uncharacterized protein BO80DRAFT_447599 [Aspergillus ibericus CBS 121593]|uniref:Uncharacterized protein n=1 Tax=Aspergillus ibericus CBS 121593 TaxID=1448316 RepID=A0A395GSR1_9EURO|nr:hypothetical protein BO80DRAFT_447599 [Aspergillus ibericus CBS 121593]RAK98234.1 hypothetical protein BO80DRAFT_447599 [Aspergillus ibericus CBS 121593]